MSLNPDPKKQVIFSRKRVKVAHPSVFFNNNVVEQLASQKQLSIYLDEKLDFNADIKGKINKANRRIGLITKH